MLSWWMNNNKVDNISLDIIKCPFDQNHKNGETKSFFVESFSFSLQVITIFNFQFDKLTILMNQIKSNRPKKSIKINDRKSI